jgi:ribosomal-protein-alanine N-acetyltransferase
VTYVATSERVGIRPVDVTDGPELVRLAVESVDLHHPWAAPPRTLPEWEAGHAARDHRLWAGFVVCELDGGAIAGVVNVSNIVRGLFQCAALGYNAFAPSAGRGLMREGLGLVVRHAFDPDGLALHRLEANIQPGNSRSIALVRGLGFRLEGFSPAFLFIDGAWRDHERWAITAEMLPG